MSIASGTSVSLQATGTYSDQSTQDISSDVSWLSSDSAVADISASGQLSGNSQGVADISASLDGVSNTTSITITSATLVSLVVSPGTVSIANGTSLALTATGTYSDQTSQDISSDVSWLSSNAAIATVNTQGQLSANSQGLVDISASMGDFISSSSVTVTSAVLVSINVTPVAASIAKGTSIALQASGVYSDQSTQNLTSQVSWQSNDSLKVRVSASGLVTGINTGSSSVSASLGGISGASTVTVTEAELTLISVTPGKPSIANGTSVALIATGIYTDNTTQDLTDTVNWQSNSPNADVVTGLVTAKSIGTATISASSGSITGTSQVEVTDAILVSMSVTPGVKSIANGTNVALIATGVYSDQTTQNLSHQANWSSSSPAIADVSVSGLVTGFSLGSASISASIGGVSSNAAIITVTDATLSSISVTPGVVSIASGTSKALIATGVYTDQSTQDLTDQVSWLSNNDIANVSASGLVTGLSIGSSSVTASIDGFSSSSLITVTAAVLNGISVTPGLVSLANGTSEVLVATGIYTDQSTQDLSAKVSWISDSAAAEVTQTGEVTALAIGTANISASLEGFIAVSAITVTEATLDAISVTPGVVALAAGTSTKLQATGHYSDQSTQDLTDQVSWQSTNDAIAEVTQAGLVTANSIGPADITASLGGQSSVSAITVTPATLSSISVTPGVVSVAAGTDVVLQATGIYSDQTTQDLTTKVSWQSDNVAAEVTPLGRVTALAIGSANISASLGGINGTSVITITAATLNGISVTPGTVSLANGTSAVLAATGIYSDQSTQNLTDKVSWISDSAAAEVTQTGEVTALAIGTANISASMGGFTGDSVITVTPAILDSISITPGVKSLAAGTSVKLQVTGYYSDQSTQDLSDQASWISDSAAAEVTQTGEVTALAIGTANISASYQGKSSVSVVTVTPATLDSISVTPGVKSLAAGTSVKLQATGHYSDQSTQDLTTKVSWISDSAAAEVTQTGEVTALVIGSVNISASYQGISSASVITVTGATLDEISVTPGIVSIAKGTSVKLQATGYYSDQTTQDLTDKVSWQSTSDVIAEVTIAGVVTANSQGLADINASLDGVSGIAAITVTEASLVSISVTPGSVSIANGTSVSLQATGIYTDQSSQDITAEVNWKSADPVIAEVTPAGKVTALTVGASSISASLDGVSGVSIVSVTPATLNAITVTPGVSAIAKGSHLSLQAIGVYTDLSTQNITAEVSWQSSAATIAEVAPGGQVTANLEGAATISASLSGQTGVASITVTAATLSSISVSPTSSSIANGTSVSLQATGIYSDQTSQDITEQVSWLSSDLMIAQVSSSGIVTGLATGEVSISAHLAGKNSAASITVTAAILTSISVTPSITSIAEGVEYQFVATGYYSDNSTQDITQQVSWYVDDSLIAEAVNNAAGAFIAKSVGSTAIAASLNGINGIATISVTDATLDLLEMSALNASLSLGSSQQLQLTAIYSNSDSQLVTTQAVWQSDDLSVVSVDANGLLDSHGIGTATVTAIYNGLSVTQSVTVTSAVLMAIEITPLKQSLPLGVAQQFTATGIYTDNTIQDITNFVTWFSSNAAVATIDNSATTKGLCTTLLSGDTTISAQLGSVLSNKALNVSTVVLNSIEIFPNAATISTGFSQRYSAIGHYSDGSTNDITEQVSWNSSNLAVAASDNNLKSTIQSYSAGNVTVSAESGGVFGFASLNVNAATLSSISIEQTAISIAKGTQFQYSASGLFSDGESRDISQDVIWASATPATATISNDADTKAVVFGHNAGSTLISASHGGVSDNSSLTVTPATLSSIALTAAKTQIVVGEALAITATGTYSDASTQDITKDVTWQSSDNAVAVISNVSENKGGAFGYSAGVSDITATLNTINSSALSLTVQLRPDEPIGISAHASPNVILNNNVDSSVVSVTVQPADASGVIADGTLIDFTVTDNGIDTPTTVGTVGGVATLTITSTNIGFISVKAQLQGSSFESTTNIYATDNFANVLTRTAFSESLYSNGQYLAGSSFGVTMQNVSNRNFKIFSYHIVNGGTDLITPVSGLNFNGGNLAAGGYAWAIFTLDSDIVDNGVQAGFTLADVSTSTLFAFLASYTP
ncbi:MAG: Ig-like domain-containing protein [Gammaproteobacteria bacterium]|nr:Ig-like domain-containing protein [Gammaproteobacteria bacterium]